MKITLEVAFAIKQVVYLKTDPEQLPRSVIGYNVRPNNSIVYELQCGAQNVTNHYDFEISEDVNVLLNSTN